MTQNQLLVQVCLRAPHVVADEAKLAIVFTYFFLLFLFLLLRLACVKISVSHITYQFNHYRIIFVETEGIEQKRKKKKKVGENNGQLRFVRHHGWRTQAAWTNFQAFIIQSSIKFETFKVNPRSLPPPSPLKNKFE